MADALPDTPVTTTETMEYTQVPELPLSPTGRTDYEIAMTKPSAEYIDPATATVAGQMESIMRYDSPLMQRARNVADVGSQRAGLLGTSMAQGAAYGAMMEKALPIAEADAGTYATLAQNQQLQQLEMGTLEKELQITQIVDAQANKWEQELWKRDYDAKTKENLMATMSNMTSGFLNDMTQGGAIAEFSAAEATQLTDFFNKMMSNMFTVADYDGFEFTDL